MLPIVKVRGGRDVEVKGVFGFKGIKAGIRLFGVNEGDLNFSLLQRTDLVFGDTKQFKVRVLCSRVR